MTPPAAPASPELLAPAEQRLPLIVLDRYLFFLSRRPISQSNLHYAWQRISGLRALGLSLPEVEDRRLSQVVMLLRGMQPQNLHEMAGRLQLTLHPLAQTALPSDVLVIGRPLQPDFWAGLRRVLLLAGPAIGIGDEVITFPLPAWIKAACPAAEIVLLSGYQDIWRGVRGVDEVHPYHDYLTLVQALRGELAFGRFDLVFLLDFESPDLYQVVCEEALLPRYVELSLGAQRAAAVDNTRRCLYRLQAPPAYFGNYYHGFDYLAGALGLRPEPAGRFSVARRRPGPPGGALRLYVSPFTSKYDPSPLYWSQLLAAIAPDRPAGRLEFVLDPGPNLATWRFAREIARSLAARLPAGATAGVAGGQNGRSLPLAGVADALAGAQAAICADSFTAHLAAALGRPALVLAGRGLEDWRVPAPASFYFSAEAPLQKVAEAMRQVLSHFGLVAAGAA
ncbi:MAG: glycosyltransferase family 9 protein, partial [Candidatus Promineifilaceae bacterium]